MSHWIQTYTGKRWNFFDCKPEDVHLEDIARALSNLCRFTGHCKCFYSVAQHSVLVSQNTSNPLLGLLHDAPEAYVGDISRPLKHAIRDSGARDVLREADQLAERAVFARFGLAPTPNDLLCLKEADMRMLVTESFDVLQGGPAVGWRINQETHPRYPFVIEPVGPDAAMRMFLDRFNEIT